jgi:hypothetical protein
MFRPHLVVGLLLCVQLAFALQGKVVGPFKLADDTGGSWTSSTMIKSTSGFCFLSTLVRLDGYNEGCRIVVQEVLGQTGLWYVLQQKSNNGGGSSVCGAYCVVTSPAGIQVQSPIAVDTDTGGDWKIVDLDVNASSGICVLIEATRLDGVNEGCNLYYNYAVGKTGYWWFLQHKSNNYFGDDTDFATYCGTQCVVAQSPLTNLAPILWTRLSNDTGGNWINTRLSPSAETACFLTTATRLDGDNEGCMITEGYVPGSTQRYWLLNLKSNNDAGTTECAATCFDVSPSGREGSPASAAIPLPGGIKK